MGLNKLSTFALLSSTILASVACGGEGAGSKSGGTATIEGHARGANGGESGEAGVAAITVMHVQADGSMVPDESDSVSTDASGYYSVDVQLSGEEEANLVVVATFEDGSEASALLSGSISEGETRIAPPMNQESTAEAEIFVSLVVSGDLSADDEEGAAILRAFIDASVGASYEEAEAGERELVASVSAAAVAAWTDANEAWRPSSSAIEGYIEAMNEADATADAESASGGSIEIDAMAGLLATYRGAGFSESDLSFAMHAAAEAHAEITRSQGEASDEGEAMRDSLALMAETRAELMASAVAESWEEVSSEGASEVEDAGDTLSASVSALIELSTEAAASSWDTATDTYASSVLVSLSATLSLDASAALASSLSVAADASAELSSAISGSGSSDASATGEIVAEAMASYRARMDAEFYAALMASGSMDQAEAAAITEIVGQLYANVE